jgi:hypothetical protein
MGGTRSKEDSDEVRGLQASVHRLDAERERYRLALVSIGKNACGREPLAAAYARGVLAETKSGA